MTRLHALYGPWEIRGNVYDIGEPRYGVPVVEDIECRPIDWPKIADGGWRCPIDYCIDAQTRMSMDDKLRRKARDAQKAGAA